MLRTRLYLGMLPIVGLLIAVCIFAANQISRLNSQLKSLQSGEYAAVLDVEDLLIATARIEASLATEVFEESDADNRRSLDAWIVRNTNSPDLKIVELSERAQQFAKNLDDINEAKERDEFSAALLIALHESGREIARLGDEIIAAKNRDITRKTETFFDQANTFYYVALATIIVSILTLGLVSYFLSQRLLAPIDKMTERVDKIADSDWTIDYKPTSNHEIAKLEIAFVAMGKRIRDFQQIMSNKLVRTRRRMEECFRNFPHPILFFNTQQSLVYTNESAQHLIDELSWEENGLPEGLTARVISVLGTGEEVVATDFDETVTFIIDGAEQHYLPLFIRIDSEEVEEIECAVILQDITTLRLSDEIKSDLVATVSHEIKTPVTSAVMALHLVLEKSLGELNEDQEDMLQTAASEMKRLERLLNNLLQIARLENKSASLNTLAVDPAEIVTNAIDLYRSEASAKEIQITAQIQTNLPKVRVDPKAIDVAFSNYISNAIKFSDPGSQIEIYAKDIGGGVTRCGVLDEGPGITEANTTALFDKFYRSEASAGTDGIGLGLSICKDIVVAQNGSVGCENRDPKGSNFYFDLPSAESLQSSAVS